MSMAHWSETAAKDAASMPDKPAEEILQVCGSFSAISFAEVVEDAEVESGFEIIEEPEILSSFEIEEEKEQASPA
jgi:hypothetical protein